VSGIFKTVNDELDPTFFPKNLFVFLAIFTQVC